MMHLDSVLHAVDSLHGADSITTTIAVADSKIALIRRLKVWYYIMYLKLTANVEVPRNSQLGFPTDMGLGTEVTPEHIIN